MIALWDHYWPAVAAGLAIGVLIGWFAFRAPRRSKRNWLLVSGAVAALAFALVWHGPVGTGERMADAIESRARVDLRDLEMAGVTATIDRDPLRRSLELAGSADTFQRKELPRFMLVIPGVTAVRWQNGRARGGPVLPLFAEASLLAVAGFLLGLLLSYLFELRRRANAGWRW
jgi:ABC-type Mn2+/Zn2+ transport system permease subunit